MLSSKEIKAFSKKLNFHITTTEHCLDILFSDRSTTLDNEVINKGDIERFIRICLKAKDRKQIHKIFYTKFLPKIVNKAKGNKTVVYFIRDNFFSAILTYLDTIEGKQFDQSFESTRLDNIDTFYFSIPEEYLFYPTFCRKKSDIVGALLAQIEKKNNVSIIDIDEFYVSIATDIAPEVGFKLFLVDMFRDIIVSAEELTHQKKMLNELSINIQAHRNKKKDKYIFIYCLCESLRDKDYKAERTYKLVSKYMNEPWTSIRTRYFEQKKKNHDYKNLIKVDELEFKIHQAIKIIAELNPPT